MGKDSGKHKQRYVYFPRDISQITCLIHGPSNSSDEFKVLNDVGTKYAKGRSFKDHRKEPTSNKLFGNNQDIDDIVQHAINEIIQQLSKNKI